MDDTDPPTDGRGSLIDQAAEVLRWHIPDQDGWCRGCSALWGRLVTAEHCTQAQWATAVHAAHLKSIGQAQQRDGSTDKTSDPPSGDTRAVRP